MKKIEKVVSQELHKQAMNMVTELQKRKLDPIGYGKIASQQDRKLG